MDKPVQIKPKLSAWRDIRSVSEPRVNVEPYDLQLLTVCPVLAGTGGVQH